MTLLNAPDTIDGYEILEEDKEEMALESVFSELGVDVSDDILLKVYKSDLGKDAHCFDCLPEGINGIEERLRIEYGKGDYKVKIMTPTPQGRKALKKTVKLSINTPLEKEEVIIDTSNDDFKSVINMMMESQNKMMAMFRESQLETQIKNQELMLSVLSKNDKEQPTLLETMALLKQMQPDQKDPMETVLSMLNINREIKKELKEDSPEPEGSMGQLINGFNTLVEAAKNNGNQPQPQPQPHPCAKDQDMNFLIKNKLKNHLKLLCIKASENKNTGLWADLTVDEIPNQFYPELINILGTDNETAFNAFAQINPDINGFKPWFMQLISEIRLCFESDDTNNETNDNLTNDNKEDDNVDLKTVKLPSDNDIKLTTIDKNNGEA